MQGEAGPAAGPGQDCGEQHRRPRTQGQECRQQVRGSVHAESGKDDI